MIIEIEVRDPTRPAGVVTVADRVDRRPASFLGWLELLGVLATLVETPTDDIAVRDASTAPISTTADDS